jgi:hypothetical protein
MSAPSISVIKTRLAAIALTVTGITRAYAEAPASLPPMDVPMFCSFVGPVTAFEKRSEQLGQETRQYIGRLYVRPIQQGYDGETEKAVEPFLTSVRDVFLAHPLLGLGSNITPIPFVRNVTWLGDGGIVVLPFGGDSFLGAEFRLSVSALTPIVIANYE